MKTPANNINQTKFCIPRHIIKLKCIIWKTIDFSALFKTRRKFNISLKGELHIVYYSETAYINNTHINKLAEQNHTRHEGSTYENGFGNKFNKIIQIKIL